MFGKLSVAILAFVLAITCALGGSADAAVRKTNVLSNVRTQIVPNFHNSGTDVCFVYNANNTSVSTLISVFPTGTLLLSVDTLTFPVLLGPFAGARVFSWTPLKPASEYCKVMVVR
jgi:thiamine pyrophosphokinase